MSSILIPGEGIPASLPRDVHRLVNHEEKQYTDGKGNHINGLEGFWGYLKRKLASKGGIRRENYLFISVNMYGDKITERKVI